MDETKKGVSRRHFIETAALTGAGLTIVPRHVLGRGFTPPSDLLNIACVGIGGMGRNNMRAVASQNIVALCDVDWDYAGKSVDRFTQDLEQRKNPRNGSNGQASGDPSRSGEPVEVYQRLVDQLPKAKRYSDYREMLDEAEGHRRRHRRHAGSHARGDRVGGDGSRQARLRAEAAVLVGRGSAASREEGQGQPKIVTQMGNQGHSRDERAATVEYIQPGAIGDVQRSARLDQPSARLLAAGHAAAGAAAATRPAAAAAAGTARRREAARRGDGRQLSGARHAVAGICSSASRREVEYHPIYHPFNWRGWVDWGQGALGDMGAHLIDHPVLGARPRHADRDRDDLDAVQRRLLPERDDDVLRVPGARRQAGR